MGRQSDYSNDMYRQLQEVMGRLDRYDDRFADLKREHREEISRLKEEHKREIKEIRAGYEDRIGKLENRIGELEEENGKLRDDNERMKRILNNDSSNSSLPPSSDQKPSRPANAYNGRQKSGKKPGGQPGHKGSTLTKKYVEEKIAAGDFKHRIKDIGKRSAEYVVRYVLDLDVNVTATEVRIHADGNGDRKIPERYKSAVTYGGNIKAAVTALYGEGVVSNERICGFLNALTDGKLSLSSGSVYGFCREFAEKSAKTVGRIKNELLNSDVLYTDATTVTVNGRQEYIRNQSTEGAVLYSPAEKKDIESLRETGIMGSYAGTVVHDHETAVYHFGTAHGECNVHLIRYNKKNTEETGNSWSAEMTELLCGMNRKKNALISGGVPGFTEAELTGFSQKYDEIIKKGREENKRTSGKYAKKEENALLNRLEKYKENHLLFAYRFEVGFSDNMSERDLRKCKNREKMAGGFRKQSGKEMYCIIMSVIETCKRKNMQVFDNIRKIFSGEPAVF